LLVVARLGHRKQEQELDRWNNYRVGKKTGLFLRVNNFAKAGDRKACDMSKFGKFYLEKNVKLAYQCVKYSLPNWHKYSMFLKLR